MVWCGLVWYGMVWYGVVWYGMVWSCYGMVMVWYGAPKPGADAWSEGAPRSAVEAAVHAVAPPARGGVAAVEGLLWVKHNHQHRVS